MGRIKVVVPLLQPWNELVEADQQRDGLLGVPGGLVHGPLVVGDEGLCVFEVIVAGPKHQQASVPVGLASGIADEALLGHVQLAAVAPIAGLLEVLCGIPGRDGDLNGFTGVFATLQIPGGFPVGAFDQALVGVALDRQRGDGFVSDQFADQFVLIEVIVAAIEGGDLGEGGVAKGEVGQSRGADQRRCCLRWRRPQAAVFELVAEPVAQATAYHVGPRVGLPAALVLGLLQQADVWVAGDEVEAALDDLLVGSGPVCRNVGDGRRAVVLEPTGFGFIISDFSSEVDLECALAQG